MTRLLLALLLLTLGGCAVLPRFVPQCEGENATLPCNGPCKVRVAGPVAVELYIPDAIVIRDDITGRVFCQGVS